MNRTQALARSLGWQGGTIHQVSEETGVNSTDLLYTDADREDADYLRGFKLARQGTIDPKEHKGNHAFWIGVAESLMLEWVLTQK